VQLINILLDLLKHFIIKKPIAFVCHSPAAFSQCKAMNGEPSKGKQLTGFSNTEEEASKIN
jgi:putative intracellular protease/amidase